MARHVVIAGGGIAGLETLLALTDLAEDRVRVTLVAPEADFETKPLRTAEPFSVDHVRRFDLAAVCREHGAEFVLDALDSVDAAEHRVALRSGETLAYDDLVLALGARPRAPFPRALTFGADADTGVLAGLLSDLEQGFSKSAAFVVPPGVSWPLPLYELALMTAGEVAAMGVDQVSLEVITPEPEPLALFGTRASDALLGLLRDAGVAFHGGVSVTAREDVDAVRVVTIPLLDAIRIPGVPADDDGFIPVDDQGRVRGLRDVYAAGDGIDYPVKQGGLATQQADAAAEAIAAEAGAAVAARPCRRILRGVVLTGELPLFLRRDLDDEPETAIARAVRDLPPAVSRVQLWWPSGKIAGRYLTGFLAAGGEPGDTLLDRPPRRPLSGGLDRATKAPTP